MDEISAAETCFALSNVKSYVKRVLVMQRDRIRR